MVALRSTETHTFTLKNLTLFKLNSELPRVTIRLRDFLNYYDYGKGDRIFDWSEELLRFPKDFEIRSSDSIITPLIIVENRVNFFTV